MAKPYHKPPTSIVQDNIVTFPSQEALEARELIRTTEKEATYSQMAIAANWTVNTLDRLYDLGQSFRPSEVYIVMLRRAMKGGAR